MAIDQKEISLDELKRGIPPGVSPATGAFSAEAAVHAMTHNKHCSGVTMRVDGRTTAFSLHWTANHADAKNSFADPDVAAEHGAYAIAFLMARELSDLAVLYRSRKSSSFDFFLGRGGDSFLQEAAHLEVSGVFGSAKRFRPRVLDKIRQVFRRKSKSLPVFVSVTDFQTPRTSWVER